MRQNRFYILFVLISILTTSCKDCQHVIKLNYISNTCYFTQGFSFQEVEVYSFQNGVPDSISVIKNIELHLKTENKSFKKKIYFYKENEDYEWFDTNDFTKHATLPIEIQKGKWYKIRGLVFRGHPDRVAFLTLGTDGELKVYGFPARAHLKNECVLLKGLVSKAFVMRL